MSQTDADPQLATGEQRGGLLREELASKLGMLGALDGFDAEFLGIFDRAPVGDLMDEYRLVAGLTLAAEAIAGMLKMAKSVDKSELAQEPQQELATPHEAPAAVLPQQPTGPYPITLSRTLELVLPPDTPAPPELLGGSSKESTPTPLPESSEQKTEQLNKRTAAFIDWLLVCGDTAEPGDYTRPPLTKAQGEGFVQLVFQAYRELRSKKPKEAEIQIAAVTLYLEDLTSKEIAARLGAPMTQARYNMGNMLQAKGYGYDGERFRAMLQEFLDKLDDIVENESMTPVEPVFPNLESVEIEAPILSHFERADGLRALCAEHWSAEDMKSLVAILDNKLGEADEPARRLIQVLMAEFAPSRNDTGVLERIEWEALSQVSGFKLEQGRKVKAVEHLRYLLSQYDSEITRPVILFKSALYKLVELAANKKFEQRLAPPSAPIPAPEHNQPAQPESAQPASAEKPKTQNEQLRELIERVCSGMGASPGVIHQLTLHFGSEKGDVNPVQLANGLRAVQQITQSAVVRTEVLSHGRTEVDSKTLLMPVDKGLLELLIGTPAKPPVTGREFVELELRRLPDLKEHMVYRRIYDTLEKAERLSRRSVSQPKAQRRRYH